MRYRFKAIHQAFNESENSLFENSYLNHEAALQAAFAYVDIFVEDEQTVEKLVGSVLDNANSDSPCIRFSHNDTTYIVEPIHRLN